MKPHGKQTKCGRLQNCPGQQGKQQTNSWLIVIIYGISYPPPRQFSLILLHIHVDFLTCLSRLLPCVIPWNKFLVVHAWYNIPQNEQTNHIYHGQIKTLLLISTTSYLLWLFYHSHYFLLLLLVVSSPLQIKQQGRLGSRRTTLKSGSM